MRLSRFLSVIFFITGLCLLHVYQQTEIFRYAYAGQKKLGAMQDLLDKNVVLRYDIEKNTSLVRIGDKISENKDFEMPDSYRLVRLKNPKSVVTAFRQAANKENIFARLFAVTREAQAKTITP